MRQPRVVSALLVGLLLLSCSEPTAPPPAGHSTPLPVQTTATRVVNSLADPGDGTCTPAQCTLREAIADSTTTSITFTAGLTGPIVLARTSQGGGVLDITHSLTITGPSSQMTVQRDPAAGLYRILRVARGASVTLRNLAVRNGRVNGDGAGIVNYGSLQLVNSIVAGNTASGAGGGIDNHGSLTLEQSTIARDTATAGAGIRNCASCRLTLVGGGVQGNAGGGILDLGGPLIMRNTLVSGNAGTGVSLTRVTATLDHVRLARNSGGGIKIFNGRLTVTDCTIAGNATPANGGGVSALDGSDVTITNSTLSGNSAALGGAIYVQAFDYGRVTTSLHVSNSTISSNAASLEGGGILAVNFEDEAPAVVTLLHTTVVRNRALKGGGLDVHNGAIFSINSIVALNQAATGPDVFVASIRGENGARGTLIGDGTGSGIVNDDGNLVGKVSPFTGRIDPRIASLADNGGATRTHALLADSPAIDAAGDADCTPADQRGVARPRGPACDMGSYER